MKKVSRKPFIKQLRNSFIIIIMIPVLFLGGFIFYSSYQYVNNQKLSECSNLIRQNAADLNNWTEQCELSLCYLAANYSLQEFLSMDETQYIEVNRAVRDINALLYNAMLTNPYYQDITVYTEKDFQAETALIKTPEEDSEKEWYQKITGTTQTCWWSIDGEFYIGRKIVTSFPTKTVGVIVVELKKAPFESQFHIFQDVPVELSVNSGGETVYMYSSVGGDATWKFQETYELNDTGWTVLYKVDKHFFDQDILVSFGVPMTVICLVLAAVWICMRFLTRYLMKDLSILVEAVNEVQNGNLDIAIEPSTTEEIHVLSSSIEVMLNKIKQLIRQVYEKEIERQNLELNLLQAKISPHFLYNNLSAINWLAIDCGEERISEITTELATFYRTALNKGKTVDSLSVEITNIKSYIKLQLIAHENGFDVEYDINETYMNCVIPTFILQPLVENAIEHGIEQLEDQRGYLRISITEEEGCLCLTVFDNGKCLFGRIGEAQMNPEEYGYGIGNVHKRIQLLYGKECGVTVFASADGTKSCIRLCINDLVNG